MRADLADWIALNMIRGIGPRTANELLERYSLPAQVFSAPRVELERFGLKPETVLELHDSEILERANAELERLEALGIDVVTLEDEAYPELLREIHDPPICLYFRGDPSVVRGAPSIAVVGSRRASTYGLNAAQSLSRDLAGSGVAILSGLARGIDGAAHRGALDAGGLTVAVVGTGLDIVYPKEHRKLQDEIAERGAVITEFPLGTPPLPQNFPYRNRILSGLSLGVLIVEAAEHSGSLITARLAYEQGREVFAVPGNITSRNSFGPNYLIKDGAKLVQVHTDVLEELPRETRERLLGIARPAGLRAETATEAAPESLFDAVALSTEELKILNLIQPDVPSHIDQLIMSCGMRTPELMNALLGLEMKDKITQLPGKSFLRRL